MLTNHMRHILNNQTYPYYNIQQPTHDPCWFLCTGRTPRCSACRRITATAMSPKKPAMSLAPWQYTRMGWWENHMLSQLIFVWIVRECEPSSIVGMVRAIIPQQDIYLKKTQVVDHVSYIITSGLVVWEETHFSGFPHDCSFENDHVGSCQYIQQRLLGVAARAGQQLGVLAGVSNLEGNHPESRVLDGCLLCAHLPLLCCQTSPVGLVARAVLHSHINQRTNKHCCQHCCQIPAILGC